MEKEGPVGPFGGRVTPGPSSFGWDFCQWWGHRGRKQRRQIEVDVTSTKYPGMI